MRRGLDTARATKLPPIEIGTEWAISSSLCASIVHPSRIWMRPEGSLEPGAESMRHPPVGSSSGPVISRREYPENWSCRVPIILVSSPLGSGPSEPLIDKVESKSAGVEPSCRPWRWTLACDLTARIWRSVAAGAAQVLPPLKLALYLILRIQSSGMFRMALDRRSTQTSGRRGELISAWVLDRRVRLSKCLQNCGSALGCVNSTNKAERSLCADWIPTRAWSCSSRF